MTTIGRIDFAKVRLILSRSPSYKEAPQSATHDSERGIERISDTTARLC